MSDIDVKPEEVKQFVNKQGQNLFSNLSDENRKKIKDLDEKVDGININLTRQIDDLEQDVHDKYNELTRDIDDLTDVVEENFSTLDTKITTSVTTINQRITDVSDEINQEIIDRQNVDNDLQEQIDGITASSNIRDIVGTYQELQDYDKSKLGDNDIIKVLQDETKENSSTYYRYISSTSSFDYIGKEGAFYTKAETDSLLNDKQDKLIAGENIIIDGNIISSTGGRGASSFAELEGNPYDNQALSNELNSLNIISLLLMYLRDSLGNNLLDKDGLTLIARR